jgi:hypothetical protein
MRLRGIVVKHEANVRSTPASRGPDVVVDMFGVVREEVGCLLSGLFKGKTRVEKPRAKIYSLFLNVERLCHPNIQAREMLLVEDINVIFKAPDVVEHVVEILDALLREQGNLVFVIHL